MRYAGRVLATLVFTIVVGGIAVGVCLAAFIPGTVELVTAHRYTVPEVKKLRVLSERSTVYWADGSVMDTLGLRDREVVSLDEVPKRVQDAIVATEDRSFWTNNGIDLGAVFCIPHQCGLRRHRAGRVHHHPAVGEKPSALEQARREPQDPGDPIGVAAHREVLQGEDSRGVPQYRVLRAGLIRHQGSGPPLLRDYGPGCALPAGKRMDELTVGEAALLAGVISSPEANNPFSYPERAIRRRAAALRAQVELGYITQPQADAANLEPLPTLRPPSEQRPDNYLVAEVQDHLLGDPALGNTPEERRNKVLKGGLDVYTTFDPRLQALAEDATTHAKPQRDDPNWVSSLVSIEYRTGAVRAMVGGPDFTGNEYNIATHTPGRQPGSTWKIITLITALANGYSANDTVDGSSPCTVASQFPGLPPDTWPTNNEGNGGRSTTIRTATTGSVNCSFVRLSTSVGQDKVIAMANQIGITQPLQRLLNLSIGTIEATPLEMATVISTLANNGVHNPPYMVTKVLDAQGEVLLDRSASTDQRAVQRRRRRLRPEPAARGSRPRNGYTRQHRRLLGIRQDRHHRPRRRRLVRRLRREPRHRRMVRQPRRQRHRRRLRRRLLSADLPRLHGTRHRRTTRPPARPRRAALHRTRRTSEPRRRTRRPTRPPHPSLADCATTRASTTYTSPSLTTSTATASARAATTRAATTRAATTPRIRKTAPTSRSSSRQTRTPATLTHRHSVSAPHSRVRTSAGPISAVDGVPGRHAASGSSAQPGAGWQLKVPQRPVGMASLRRAEPMSATWSSVTKGECHVVVDVAARRCCRHYDGVPPTGVSGWSQTRNTSVLPRHGAHDQAYRMASLVPGCTERRAQSPRCPRHRKGHCSRTEKRSQHPTSARPGIAFVSGRCSGSFAALSETDRLDDATPRLLLPPFTSRHGVAGSGGLL